MKQDSDPPAAAATPVAAVDPHSDGRILDPIDRNSEILFGLFMVLTFTGTLSVASAGREDVRTMLIAAIGCNIAWGFVDGVMYVLRNLVSRGRQISLVRTVRAATRPEDAHRLIAHRLGPLSSALDPAALERLRRWVADQSMTAATRVTVNFADLKGALAVFLLVFSSTFPVVLPFVFIADLRLAMRVSAAIAIAMMFACGWGWGRYAGLVPWRSGLALVVLGCGVEAVIIALGG
jgi:hypothetical protein